LVLQSKTTKIEKIGIQVARTLKGSSPFYMGLKLRIKGNLQTGDCLKLITQSQTILTWKTLSGNS